MKTINQAVKHKEMIFPFMNFRKIQGTNAIYRSGYVGNHSSECFYDLSDMGVNTLIDFRSKEEIACSKLVFGIQNSPINYLHLPIEGYEGEFKQLLSPTIYDYTTYYLRIMMTGVESFRAFLNYLLQNDGGVLFGCYAGKDRTGIAAFLLHHLLGSTDEIISSDFLETNPQIMLYGHLFEQNWLKRGITQEEYFDRIKLDDSFYYFLNTAVVERFGSFKHYITNVLGFSSNQQQIIISKII